MSLFSTNYSSLSHWVYDVHDAHVAVQVGRAAELVRAIRATKAEKAGGNRFVDSFAQAFSTWQIRTEAGKDEDGQKGHLPPLTGHYEK